MSDCSTRRFACFACGLLVGCICCVGAPAQAVSPDFTGEDPADLAGQHDMLLLLPDGPVHLRARITDAGKPLSTTRRDYLTNLVASLDTDQDGKLDRNETDKHPLFASTRRFEDNSFLNSLRSRRPYTEHELEMSVSRAAGQLVTYRQNDALADQDLSVFQVLDENGSGLIERVEMRLAAARIAERDNDFDHCVTFNEFVSDAPSMTNNILVNSIDTEPPGAVHSELLRDAREPILAGRLVRRYDTDRDAHLTAEELRWRPSRIKHLDADGDTRLSRQELSRIATAEPDISLAVDLSKQGDDAMRLVGQRPPDVEITRADLVRLRRDGFSLTTGFRFRDPLAEAEQNATVAFNAIDTDTNGYLDRDEIAEHQRFERYLFDAMDGDEDDRVFADEMMSYVRDYTQPASATCQVTLLDTGNGLFQKLDENADGRVAIRELRSCEQTLLKLADAKSQINPSRITKSYRIEFCRGGVSLFGRVDRPDVETPAAILKPPSGPIWFQRMDRNGDDDLTWDEFLGPREVFHRLDKDQDHLIDQNEAEQGTDE